MYGAQARKNGRERVVPSFWRQYGEGWLQGFDGEPIPGVKTKPVSDQLEEELDDSAVGDPPGETGRAD